ncbi:MAG TPA: L,D-transpeptidase family protein [Bryobacteraceae bacterium]|nr:L,D-transpeptidase family protein [Bryobacteraceae bacterium]
MFPRKATCIALLTLACSAAGAQTDAPATLRQIADAGNLADLRWPDFSDYRLHFQNFYQPTGYVTAWLRGGRASQQALAIIEVLGKAGNKGLDAEDYDGSRWAARVAHLPSASQAEAAHFDAALTVCLMRYISDLHIGKVNPHFFHFGLDVERKKYSLPDFLRQRLVDAPDPAAVLELVEPPFPGYKRTQAALMRYIDLARKDDGEQLPAPAKPVTPGSPYTGLARLTRLLRLVGDLPPDAQADDNSYTGELVNAVKSFQRRHGLQPDGRLDAQTIKCLNTPLSFRIRQMQLTLERWRWLPHDFEQPPIIVNIPEFHLRAYSTYQQGPVALEMNVIVGKAYGHKTPVFAEDMQYVVLRPYWNVPPSIQRGEVVPAIQKDRDYIAKKGFEVTTHGGELVAAGSIDDDVLAKLRAGVVEVRQKPGPSNSLGLVKLIFPNKNNVYLHSTPAQELFARTRRDFSHGCIRVEKPDELTAWVLRNNPGWNLERVREAMKNGKDNQHVNLAKPIPVLILYGTAIVDEAGAPHFLDDIYGLDADLEKVLVKGYPYPG